MSALFMEFLLMCQCRMSIAVALFCGVVLLACPVVTMAQRHGGGSTSGGGGLSAYSRPDGVDEKDSLQDFHRAMEVQATSQQVAEFQALVKSTEAANAKIEEFQQRRKEKNADLKRLDPALDQILQDARDGSRKFVAGFSDTQKSGLKEITKRLIKADSDLDQEEKKLDQSLQVASAEVATRAESLDKAFAEFSNEQLALGREMGIILANGQDLTFNLHPVKHATKIDNSNVGVTTSGALSQIAVDGNQRTFRLELIADLSDLQQNITELLHAQLDRSDRCGEHVAVREATLTPSPPASVLFLRLHFERWICTQLSGRPMASELGEGDGSVEMKLMPSFEKSGDLKLTAELGRIDATAMMSDALRSGDLGDDLRDKVRRLILSAMQAGADLKTDLPTAVQGNAVVQNIKFRDAGAGDLSIALDGRVQISNDQASLLATELNQTFSAQPSSTR